MVRVHADHVVAVNHLGTPPWIQSLTPTAIYLIYLIYRRRIFVENIKSHPIR